jgi:signal-transduction protein with cAMP-binding, CBS, and nucleotidyltransferase domain
VVESPPNPQEHPCWPKLTTVAYPSRQIHDFLSKTAPFSELNREEINRLAAKAQVKGYAAGSTILARGKSKISHLMLIYSGRVKLFMTTEDGQENVFSFRKSGQTVGALGILRESLSNLDVMAIEETVCLFCPGMISS